MTGVESIRGDVVQCERPNFEPLVCAVGHELASWFMWMFDVELADGTTLDAYKHVTTRRYLHLDATGRAFRYDETGRYQTVAAPIAIARVFVGLEESSPTGQ